MKNRRIPGFPSPEDQDIIQFYVLKKLSYTTRMLLYFSFIVIGFLIQIITVDYMPGAIFLILAAILNLVKGYNSKPTPELKHDESSWTKTDIEKVYQINKIKQSINIWDKDALDISNGLGCAFFGAVILVVTLIFSVLTSQIGYNIAQIFLIDSFILILSLWFSGMRKKGHQDILYIKADIIIELEKYFNKIKKGGENFVPSMILTKDKSGKDFPTDCRFNIIFDNAPAGFYGVQAQININVVSTNYPYFYCVITSKSGFGLGVYVQKLNVPNSIVMQYSNEGEAEVIVIRQHTTKSSGYHTKMNACKNILETALTLARLILEENKGE